MAERRVFFALQPERAAREALAALPLRHGLHAKRVQAIDDIHMTLVFIGSVAATRIEALRETAAGISGISFEIALWRVDYWAGPRIACAVPDDPPAALLDLQDRLARALRALGLAIEERVYRPHVTLARGVTPFTSFGLDEAVQWRVDRFLLYDSVSDGREPRYRPLGEFPLVEPGRMKG